ncbi:hypothetical protein [Opitutus sp. GAS368]|uniref:hypothetical protein n=1 Tax=Opitutus sp. GAS368 TaxID=1882749 RepID=UPI00087D9C1D|nr:hypothetical protein [Opitutus sp. GAS368]SDS33108.1 SnoaL-like domain-containing protein [Opitutus sp. GAS368]
MKKILIAFVATILTAAQIPAAEPAVSPEAAVLKPVDQFLDGFNKGDTKMMLAAGAEQMSILDEFPPHEWHGAGAFAQWMSDFDADAAKHGITNGSVSAGKPSHIDITGADAYVVIKANYSFKRRGKFEEEIGSTITVTLHQGADGWRITGWAWAKR